MLKKQHTNTNLHTSHMQTSTNRVTFPLQIPQNACGFALREANPQSYKMKAKNNPLRINFRIFKYS